MSSLFLKAANFPYVYKNSVRKSNNIDGLYFYSTRTKSVNIPSVKGQIAIKATGGPDNIAFVYCYDVNIIM